MEPIDRGRLFAHGVRADDARKAEHVVERAILQHQNENMLDGLRISDQPCLLSLSTATKTGRKRASSWAMTLVNDLRLQFSTELMSDAPPRKGRSVTTAAGPLSRISCARFARDPARNALLPGDPGDLRCIAVVTNLVVFHNRTHHAQRVCVGRGVREPVGLAMVV